MKKLADQQSHLAEQQSQQTQLLTQVLQMVTSATGGGAAGGVQMVTSATGGGAAGGARNSLEMLAGDVDPNGEKKNLHQALGRQADAGLQLQQPPQRNPSGDKLMLDHMPSHASPNNSGTTGVNTPATGTN